METVYLDVLVFSNFVINYILLLVTAKISATGIPRFRLFLGAVFGSIYAAVAVLMPIGLMYNILTKAVVGEAMVLIAFVGRARIVRLSAVFFAVSSAFGGALLAISTLSGGDVTQIFLRLDFKVFLMAFAVCYCVVTVFFRCAAKHFKMNAGLVAVILRHQGRVVSLRALIDTGNSLTDPITGSAVLIAGVRDLKPLLSPKIYRTVMGDRLKDVVCVLEELYDDGEKTRFQLIPYSAVGITGGMLLAFRPDEIIVQGRHRAGMLLALSPNSVSENGMYAALIGA